MIDINAPIVPFEGTERIKLYQSLDETKSFLSAEGIVYREEYWSAESETVPNPWNVIVIDGIASLFFARNKKLFKIVFWENYQGALPNGVHTGMSMDDALNCDCSLRYDDWNEVYISDAGYWIEDNLETKQVMSISVFIKELLDDNSFDYCEW